MKLLILSLMTLSLSAFATDFRLIDKSGLLKGLTAELKNKSVSDYHKGDEAEILTQGQLKTLKVKRANKKVVVLKGGIKKEKITAAEFDKADHNMMNIVLANSNFKVTVNGTVYENTYLVSSVRPTTHALDDGTIYKAYEVVVTSPDVDYTGWGMEPSVIMSFVISPEAPAVAQMLKVTLNGNTFYDVRSVSLKK
ncbi:MAG: hypothetical protein ACOYL6_17690 [Bacteriovoracaceae bacterium]